MIYIYTEVLKERYENLANSSSQAPKLTPLRPAISQHVGIWTSRVTNHGAAIIAIIVISCYGIFQESRANCYSKYVFLSKTSPGLHENPISIFFPQPNGKYRLLFPRKCELSKTKPKIRLIKTICPLNAPFPGVS